MKGTLIVIVGPTGSGKTALSIELAKRFGAPIISFDSRQVFRGMAVGTAQPTDAELAAARHYFIADREVTDDYNSGKFAAEALELLDRLFEQHRYVIAVGGSGLYIDALCNGFDPLPEADNKLRAELAARLTAEGVAALAEELRMLDPDYYEVVDRNNPARVMRALEVCLSTGKPYSAQRTAGVCDHSEESAEHRRSNAERNFRTVKIGIDMPRAELYERINNRVDTMLEEGLESEARALYHLRNMNALNTVGYKELFDYFNGATTIPEAVELIKRNSRRYAKRQMTWFGRDQEIKWFSPTEIDAIIYSIEN